MEGIDLEDDDVWPLDAGGGAVTMHLREGAFERLSNPDPAHPEGPIWIEELVGDQDEISIRNDADSAVLEALDGTPLRYRLGATGSLLASDRLVLEHVRKAATIRNPTLSMCPPPSDVENEPSLSLWYVPEPVTVGSDEIDDEIAERLRALGYQW